MPVRKLITMAPRRAAPVPLLVSLLLAAACSGSDDAPSASQRFEEGEVRLEIEFLDIGLLKGHVYGEAEEGWRVAEMNVTAIDHREARWGVIETEREGFGSTSANELMEVRLQELPRGQQLTISATVTFEDGSGKRQERSVTDRWPP
ncbi:MAG TPA: hypothetical protein VGR43_05735 [Dehalococcoidia bacterium]|jgi:hypothetical protein|nr:hypothetical protein [Dehalococcoidia bacterium]